jgi:hypothetical protein
MLAMSSGDDRQLRDGLATRSGCIAVGRSGDGSKHVEGSGTALGEPVERGVDDTQWMRDAQGYRQWGGVGGRCAEGVYRRGNGRLRSRWSPPGERKEGWAAGLLTRQADREGTTGTYQQRGKERVAGGRLDTATGTGRAQAAGSAGANESLWGGRC